MDFVRWRVRASVGYFTEASEYRGTYTTAILTRSQARAQAPTSSNTANSATDVRRTTQLPNATNVVMDAEDAHEEYGTKAKAPRYAGITGKAYEDFIEELTAFSATQDSKATRARRRQFTLLAYCPVRDSGAAAWMGKPISVPPRQGRVDDGHAYDALHEQGMAMLMAWMATLPPEESAAARATTASQLGPAAWDAATEAALSIYGGALPARALAALAISVMAHPSAAGLVRDVPVDTSGFDVEFRAMDTPGPLAGATEAVQRTVIANATDRLYRSAFDALAAAMSSEFGVSNPDDLAAMLALAPEAGETALAFGNRMAPYFKYGNLSASAFAGRFMHLMAGLPAYHGLVAYVEAHGRRWWAETKRTVYNPRNFTVGDYAALAEEMRTTRAESMNVAQAAGMVTPKATMDVASLGAKDRTRLLRQLAAADPATAALLQAGGASLAHRRAVAASANSLPTPTPPPATPSVKSATTYVPPHAAGKPPALTKDGRSPGISREGRPVAYCDHCNMNGHSRATCFALNPHLSSRSGSGTGFRGPGPRSAANPDIGRSAAPAPSAQSATALMAARADEEAARHVTFADEGIALLAAVMGDATLDSDVEDAIIDEEAPPASWTFAGLALALPAVTTWASAAHVSHGRPPEPAVPAAIRVKDELVALRSTATVPVPLKVVDAAVRELGPVAPDPVVAACAAIPPAPVGAASAAIPPPSHGAPRSLAAEGPDDNQLDVVEGLDLLHLGTPLSVRATTVLDCGALVPVLTEHYCHQAGLLTVPTTTSLLGVGQGNVPVQAAHDVSLRIGDRVVTLPPALVVPGDLHGVADMLIPLPLLRRLQAVHVAGHSLCLTIEGQQFTFRVRPGRAEGHAAAARRDIAAFLSGVAPGAVTASGGYAVEPGRYAAPPAPTSPVALFAPGGMSAAERQEQPNTMKTENEKAKKNTNMEKAKTIKFKVGDNLTEDEATKVQHAIAGCADAFAYSMQDLASTGYAGEAGVFTIPLKANWRDLARKCRPRAYERPRPLSPADEAVHNEKCEELYGMGFIEEAPTMGDHDQLREDVENGAVDEGTHGDFAANPIIAPKKDELGNWDDKRWCIDYRGVNSLSRVDHFQLPKIEDIFDALPGRPRVLMSALDARNHFGNMTIAPADRHKTCFWWRKRLFQCVRLPFGLRNGPAQAQRLSETVLWDGEDQAPTDVFVYIDDILIVTAAEEGESSEAHLDRHLARTLQILARFRDKGILMHPKKSVFATDKVQYLGHTLTPGRRAPQDAKVEAIKALPPPTNISSLRSVLGFVQYYAKYIGPRFSAIAKPMTRLLKKDQPWEWGGEQQQALDTLKRALMVAPAFRPPMDDRNFIVHTDYSRYGIGAVLTQIDDEGSEFIVATVSRTLNDAEAKYSPFYGECLGVVYAVKSFRIYLHGRFFLLVTDHQPLSWLMQQSKLSSHHARWAMALAGFHFQIVHRPGLRHQNADGLSRNAQDIPDHTDAQLDRSDSHLVTYKPLQAYTLAEALGAYASPPPAVGAPLPTSPDHAAICFLAGRHADPWLDEELLHYVRHRDAEPDACDGVTAATVARARPYSWSAGQLFRMLWNGHKLQVPPPHLRRGIIDKVHHDAGHVKHRRCVGLLSRAYFWPGLSEDVRDAIRSCATCDRIGAAFEEAVEPQLQPLPIQCMFYRWHVDLKEKLVVTAAGHTDILIAIDAYTKYMVAAPLVGASSAATAAAFRDRVLGVFGAPAEVVTDQGSAFKGQFAELLEGYDIDHRMASARHPQSNGQAERAVQIVKRGLAAAITQDKTRAWDDKLADIVFAYNISKQASTGFSPYTLVFAAAPPLPAALREPLDFADADGGALARSLAHRAAVLAEKHVAAGANLHLAQARDRVQWRRKVRDPRKRFASVSPGDFVYLRQVDATGLEAKAKIVVLRVREITKRGVYVLEGLNGSTVRVTRSDIVPCLLPMLASMHLHRVAVDEVTCEICGHVGDDADMCLCALCARGWHASCFTPPLVLAEVADDWCCPRCHAASLVPDMRSRNVGHDGPVLDGVRGVRAWILDDGKRRGFEGVLRYQEGTFMIYYDDGQKESVSHLLALIFAMNGDGVSIDERVARRQLGGEV